LHRLDEARHLPCARLLARLCHWFMTISGAGQRLMRRAGQGMSHWTA
jgi:hypothetical protein